MVRSKPPSSSKKPKKKGIDFKKVKRHVGRKLPPPKNATSTEIKTKAIVLPEQTMVADRTDMAVSKKGLTLRELLQQTSHYNSKFRRAALNGIRDLIMKHPLELKTHKLAIIEKLRERICDSDKAVREVLYNIFDSVIFKSLKEDIKGPTVALLMAYIFNAMTHMTVEIRLSAFKFFRLLVHSYPSSFFMHSDKVLDHYVDILRNSQIYLQEKNQLSSILSGLEHCLSLYTNKTTDTDTINSQKKGTAGKWLLHAYRESSEEPIARSGYSSNFDKIENLIPVLVNCFEESMSLFSTTPDATSQSFKILSYILQCLYSASDVLVQNSNMLKEHPSCSILVHLRKILEGFPFGLKNDLTDKVDEEFFILNVKIAEVYLLLGGWMGPMSYLANKFLYFIERTLLDKAGIRLNKKNEDNLASLLAYMPELISHVTNDWKDRLLEAFTGAYKECNVESKLLLAYLSCVEEMLLPEKGRSISGVPDYVFLVRYQIEWIREFPRVLLHLGDKYLSVKENTSKEESAKKEQHLLMLGQYMQVILNLLLRVGQTNVSTSPLAAEFDTIQLSLEDFFNAKPKGIFMKIPCECQALAVSCLYYFSSLTPALLKSLSSCCLCEELDPVMLFKIIEVLHSAYRANRLHLSEHLGFLLTLISHFRIYAETAAVKTLNQDLFKTTTRHVLTYLSQMGDGSILLKMLWGPLSEEIARKPALANMHGLMRMVVRLDMRLSKLSASEVHDLAGWVFSYMITSSIYLPKRTGQIAESENTQTFRYLLKPCIRLFLASNKLLSLILDLFNPFISGENDDAFSMEPARKVQITIYVLTIMHDEIRSQINHCLSESLFKGVIQNIIDLLEADYLTLAFDEMRGLRLEFEQLKTRICTRD
ncbi:ARM repeat superfamily protein [Rhynchospora pubera]|uniref:ARM repeat superfamily protein n=1 Tax=Rhynchospora pubera TaxID=906938 RepID=A0AAV8HNI9_9POAL|nr:ARM repeat superfamily protein [Rhynchospora pubera]